MLVILLPELWGGGGGGGGLCVGRMDMYLFLLISWTTSNTAYLYVAFFSCFLFCSVAGISHQFVYRFWNIHRLTKSI